MKSTHSVLIIIAATLALTPPIRACDLSGCYTPSQEALQDSSRVLYFGVAEQFTHFGSLKINGHDVPNPSGQYVNSSVTQAVLGASFLDARFGLQLNIPSLYRAYRRPEGTETAHGTVSGLGDVTLQANYVVWRTGKQPVHRLAMGKDATPYRMEMAEPAFSGSLNLIAGLKLPTGDTARLKENFQEGGGHSHAPAQHSHAPEEETDEHAEVEEAEAGPESAIGGHDLTLGSGSYDGVFSLHGELRYQRAFLQADVNYTVRGPGAHQYRFANDLDFTVGPGWYFYRENGRYLGLQAILSGETKGYDHFQGEADLNTGATALYVGPRVVAALGRVNGEIGLELPVLMHTTQLQVTTDYRIRAGFSVQF